MIGRGILRRRRCHTWRHGAGEGRRETVTPEKFVKKRLRRRKQRKGIFMAVIPYQSKGRIERNES
jgi:hypothetical protein